VIAPFEDPVLVALVEVLERSGTAFFVFREVDGGIAWRYISKPYAELVGVPLEELYASPVLARVVDEQHAAMRGLAQVFIDGGEMPAMLEVTLKHGSGSTIQVETTMIREMSETGPVGVVMVNDKHAKAPQLNLLEADRISWSARSPPGSRTRSTTR